MASKFRGKFKLAALIGPSNFLTQRLCLPRRHICYKKFSSLLTRSGMIQRRSKVFLCCEIPLVPDHHGSVKYADVTDVLRTLRAENLARNSLKGPQLIPPSPRKSQKAAITLRQENSSY